MDEAQPIESAKLYDFLNWAHLNRQKIIVVVGLAAAVGIGLALMAWRHDENEIAANQALFSTPGSIVVSASAQPASAEALLKISTEYPGTAAGNRAALLGATRLYSDGKFVAALTAFSALAGSAAIPSIQAAAAYGVAASLDAQGKSAEASAQYLQVISQFPEEPVAPLSRLALGRIDEAGGKHEAAYRLYQEIANAGPYDPWAAEANERRQELLAQFPDLAKSAPTVVPMGLPVTAPGAAPKL